MSMLEKTVSSTEQDVPQDMSEFYDADQLVATDEQCEVLLSPDYRFLIKHLWQRPYSRTELQEVLDYPEGTVTYRLNRMLELGIVKLAFEQRRRGRPVKRFVMRTGQWVLPFRSTPSETLEQLVFSNMRAHHEEFTRATVKHLKSEIPIGVEPTFLMRPHDGLLALEFDVPESILDERCVIYWRPVLLDPNDVLELQRQMMALVESFVAQADPRRRREHLLGLQLVRRLNEDESADL